MEHGKGGRRLTEAAEDLVLRTIAAHADSLLRTARRHSINADDAQDAYQRGLEIFLRHAERLDPAGAPSWLHTVVKREAMAIRRSRQKLVAVADPDLDAHPARREPTADERALSVDLVGRSAEALQRLKPQELRALWLKAQGHSYGEIGEITGWTYTKVNRCLTEGRRSFLARYAEIESGAECSRWAPVISAMVDGEATPEQLLALRPHLRNCPACRASLKALQDTSAPLAALLPVPLVVLGASGGGDLASNLLMRVYEAIAGGVHDRAMVSMSKMQAVLETSTAAKAWAVAASAAAVAGGGYATVQQVAGPAPDAPAAQVRTVDDSAPAPDPAPVAATPVAAAPDPAPAVADDPPAAPTPEFADDPAPAPRSEVDREFGFEKGRSARSDGAQPGAVAATTDASSSSASPSAPVHSPTASSGHARPSTDDLGEFDP